MVSIELGPDRLTPPHPPKTFELAQATIKVPFEAQLHHSRVSFATRPGMLRESRRSWLQPLGQTERSGSAHREDAPISSLCGR